MFGTNKRGHSISNHFHGCVSSSRKAPHPRGRSHNSPIEESICSISEIDIIAALSSPTSSPSRNSHNEKHYADNKYRQKKWETSAFYVACIIIFCHYATAFELTNLWTKFVNLLKRLTQPRHMHLITGITIMPPSPIQISPAPIRAMPAG